ncbi:cyclic nucleotide-binding-like protein [Naematelia encephala]|uniref:cAMP-dependent protein kinase regulatory subunit n=1 Tax=Naematelia encephala TaxID=71784 RepID=A0A1Y2B458_9TREE|nr:cyclic nucleotide-binding-like protein [Naematelia encephala]
MSTSWTELLNELNRDVSREQPKDVVQWGSDWFQARLKRDRMSTSGTSNVPLKRGPPGSLSAFSALPSHDLSQAPHTPSPFSETGPSDNPFGGPRRATVPTGSNNVNTGAPIFSAPFGAAPAREASPFGDVPSFAANPFGQAQSAPSAEEQQDEPPVPSYALGRRTSVSAESLVPTNQRGPALSNGLETTMEEDETTPNQGSTAIPVFPKTEEQLARIKSAIKPNFLFRNLDEEQEADVLAAMNEVTIPAGEMIIEQGAAGDYFYVVESGKLDVFVKRDGQVLDPEKGDKPALGKKVATCTEGNSFGELALMHNAPRAASIISLTPCNLWALDRVSFRTILLDHTSRKRRLYESFLAEVPILASLQPQERAKIADVLESRTFTEGEAVITEGDAGEEFFLIESGSAVAIKKDASGQEIVVKQLVKGDYFGELALLNHQTRAATVRAEGAEKLRVAALGEQAFTRLLGPVKDIMARNVGERYGFAAGR